MHIIDMFNYIYKTEDFYDWSQKQTIIENPIQKFNPDIGVNLTSKCNMKCEHCCFKLYLNQDEEFDYEKFYIFLEKFLIEFKEAGHDSIRMHFNCGELTLLPIEDLLNFLYRCLTLYKKYDMKLSFRINSNLLNIGKALPFFLACRDICKTYSKEFIFYTSIDYYHFEKGFYKEQYENIKLLKSHDINVTANTIMKSPEEFYFIYEKYKDLNLNYVIQILKDYEELENPCNKFEVVKDKFKEFDEIKKMDNVSVSYHVNGCHRFKLKAIYTYNNTIVQCPFFAPYKFDNQFDINPDNYNSISDLYNSKLFQVERYLIDNINKSNYNICPITYYYNQNFQLGELSDV